MRPIHESGVAEFEPVSHGPSRLSRLRRGLSTVVGACAALALLLALGVWFYRLGVRDAENVPIIRAAAEPAKERPEDPGGAVAPHQEITSYRVAEAQPASAAAAIIAPPPPEPKREDVAMGALPPAPADRPAPPAAAATDPVAAAPSGAAAPVAAPAPTPASASEPAGSAAGIDGQTLALAAPATDPATDPAAAQAADPALPVDPVRNASDLAPPLSPVAPRRPGDLKARMVAAVQVAEQNASDLARRAAESTIQVQLAADPSEDVVRTMWRRIAQANSDILHDRELAVQTTISGGTKFYRLRVGPFGGLSEARAVCQALKARGQDCIVARNG